jgi:CHAT domain-containing protein
MFNIALANERQSLATAILELGARNVIATLWPVDDRASLLFMASFYDALRGAAPADALRLAQHWMRSTTDGQKKTWVRDRLASHEKGSRVREGLIGLYRDLALRDQQERHYAQAYYWAGYQLHGLQTGWI